MQLMPTSVLNYDFTTSTPTSSTGHPIEVSGRYRTVTIDGIKSLHPISATSFLKLPTDQHTKDTGTIVLWLSPLESLSGSPDLHSVASKDPNWQKYGLLGDALPINDINKTIFALYWQNRWHSQLIAKFKAGPAAGQAADFSVTPYVAVEHLPLHGRAWYQVSLTWDKPASRIRIYINGVLTCTTLYPFKAEMPHAELYLGNPAMAFARIDVFDVELDEKKIAESFAAAAFPKNEEIARELREFFTVVDRKNLNWLPTADWVLREDRSFIKPDDLADWSQQGCLVKGFELVEKKITPQGLLLQTPDQIHIESRVYFWSPRVYEGDVAVEFEFRPEQTTGLALLVVQASGIHREDFLTDHPRRTTGSMETIIGDRVRNYHWEFYRKAVDVRGDLGTQVLCKNPWERPMAMVALPPYELHRWYKLRFVQEGPRLRGSIDGQLCFDVTDDAFLNMGPVLNAGRIALRLMYGSRMRFRNLKVWNRNDLLRSAEL
jgi:hypothetical protein